MKVCKYSSKYCSFLIFRDVGWGFLIKIVELKIIGEGFIVVVRIIGL